MTDVVVVSVFGRGHWLAAELASKNLKVQLVDASESLGRWAPEDWEGPFAWLKADWLTTSQMTSLSEDDYHDEVDCGVSLWLKDGPVDTRGLLHTYFSQSLPFYGRAEKYVNLYSQMKAQIEADGKGSSQTKNLKAQIEDMQDELASGEFSQSWLAHLSHGLAATEFMPNAFMLESGEPLPLWSPLAIRRVSRKGLQKSLDWCTSNGVEVFRSAKVEDVASEGKDVGGVQIGGSTNRVLRCKQVVWCLSSEETQFVSPKSAIKLFPRGVLSPEWCWLRWRLQVNWGKHQDVVPAHFIFIAETGLPWTHENLLICQRASVTDQMDVWARIPTHHRFQRSYLEDFGRKIIDQLAPRLPDLNPQIQDPPQDYHYSFNEMGPTLWPVMDPKAKSQWQPFEFKNLYFSGPEWQKNLDVSGRLSRQNQIVRDILRWQFEEIEKAKKQNKGIHSDQPLHPN